jgi:hypothetical protein
MVVELKMMNKTGIRKRRGVLSEERVEKLNVRRSKWVWI